MKKSKILSIALFPIAIGILASCGDNNNPDPGDSTKYKVTEVEWKASFGEDKPYYIADNYKLVGVLSAKGQSLSNEVLIDGNKLKSSENDGEGVEITYNEISEGKKYRYDYDSGSKKWSRIEDDTTIADGFIVPLKAYCNNYSSFAYNSVDKSYKCTSLSHEGQTLTNLEIKFENKQIKEVNFDTTEEGHKMNMSFTFTYGGQTVTLPSVDPVSKVFTYTINGSEQKALAELKEDLVTGYFAYESIIKDDVISFYVDGSLISENINADETSNIVPNGQPGQFVALNNYTPEEGVPSFGIVVLDGGYIVNGGQDSPQPEACVKLMGVDNDWVNGKTMSPVTEGSLEYVIYNVTIATGDEIKIKFNDTWIDKYKREGEGNALALDLASVIEGGNAKFLLGGTYSFYFNSDENAGDQYGVFIKLENIPNPYVSEGAYREGSVIIDTRSFKFNKVDLANSFVEYKVINAKATSDIEYTFKNGETIISDYTYETPADIYSKFDKNGNKLKYTGAANGLDIYLKVSLTGDPYKFWVEEHLDYIYDLTIHSDSSQSTWAFKDCDLFVYVIDSNNFAEWLKVTANDGLINVTVPENTIKFLVVRCVIGTETPDWSVTSGNEPGRIYDKSSDTDLLKGVGEYTVTFTHYGD